MAVEGTVLIEMRMRKLLLANHQLSKDFQDAGADTWPRHAEHAVIPCRRLPPLANSLSIFMAGFPLKYRLDK
jgi:hypothetical protein